MREIGSLKNRFKVYRKNILLNKKKIKVKIKNYKEKNYRVRHSSLLFLSLPLSHYQPPSASFRPITKPPNILNISYYIYYFSFNGWVNTNRAPSL